MKVPTGTFWQFCLSLLICAAAATPVHAQVSAESKKILERIAGTKVPGDDAILKEVDRLLTQGKRTEAVEKALTHPGFLNVTVKQMALKMSTREETTRTPFNDFSAAIVGAVRDQMDARMLLRGNFYYMGNSASGAPSNLVEDLLKSNKHYEALDNAAIDLGKVLVKIEGQKVFSASKAAAVANPDPAGVLTSRSFLAAHTVAGTNRRAVEYTFREFMCTTIEEWSDTNASAERIGRDIDRNPGNVPTKFENSCKGCHTQMDGFRGAFAYWNFKGTSPINSVEETANLEALGFEPSKVVIKMNHNNTVYPSGYKTLNNQWVNNAVGTNNNARFKWRGSQSAVLKGTGVGGLGALISDSRRFSECMVKRVFEATCRPKDLSFRDHSQFINEYANRFESSTYNLRKLFADVVISRECGQ